MRMRTSACASPIAVRRLSTVVFNEETFAESESAKVAEASLAATTGVRLAAALPRELTKAAAAVEALTVPSPSWLAKPMREEASQVGGGGGGRWRAAGGGGGGGAPAQAKPSPPDDASR